MIVLAAAINGWPWAAVSLPLAMCAALVTLDITKGLWVIFGESLLLSA
jgi:hypothetical protein